MARKIEWTVRIIIHHEAGIDKRYAGRDGWWLDEALRYAGISSRIAEFNEPNRREVFELHCPNVREHDTKVWAEQNAARLRSFGMDAAAAPRWDGLKYSEQMDERAKLVRTFNPPPTT